METPLNITAGHALRLGGRALKPAAAYVGLLFAARTVQGIVGVSIGPALLAALSGGIGSAVFPAAGLLWLLAQLGASLSLAAFARAAAAQHGTLAGGRPSGPFSDALGFLFVGGALATAARLWVWTALLAAGFSFARAVATGSGGAPASLGLALALTISLVLGFLVAVWVRLALARAAVRDRGYLVALHELAGALFRRGGRPVWVFLLGGFTGWLLEVGASGALAPLMPSLSAPGASAFLLSRGVVGAVLTGAIAAVTEAWVLGAFTALELADARALGEAALPPAPVVPVAPLAAAPVAPPEPEAVLDALPAEPAPSLPGSPGEPVIEALPVSSEPNDPER